MRVREETGLLADVLESMQRFQCGGTFRNTAVWEVGK